MSGSSLVQIRAQIARECTGNYIEHKTKIIPDFLSTFIDAKIPKHEKWGYKKYLIQLQEITNRHRYSLVVDIGDIEIYCTRLFEAKDEMGLQADKMGYGVVKNTTRYVEFFHEAAASLMPKVDKDFNDAAPPSEHDRLDKWRRAMYSQGASANFPSKVLFNFDVRFCSEKIERIPLRQVKANHVGGLVSIDGIVTKAALVKPRMQIVVYVCGACKGEIFQVVEGDSYKPTTECPTPTCKTNKRSALETKLRGSKFVRFQEIKLQENHNDVPTGSVPRSMNVYMLGDLCRSAMPGDSVTVQGVYNIMKVTGAHPRFSDHVTFIQAHGITKHKRGYRDDDDGEIENQISEMREIPELYNRLAESIAPEIFGHLDVKKALLLSLIGGTGTKQTDGMKIRGDLHVLLMGDPGVAKSQLLKQVVKIAPRSVYTTGKGTSGVGLTAAVMRDPTTNEMTLEGGALVLADNGVCCIDEFDKMEEHDRTAIHEVMEQQVLNIAKAGITTTLNARCSVLAAANPIYGRYNPNKSPMDNMAMPAALLSRFDLKFLLLDHTDMERDMELAAHVLDVHRFASKDSTVPQATDVRVYDARILRAYIKRARKFDPTISPALKKTLITKYVETRQKERGQDVDERVDYTTPRALLGLLRLCQALARVRFSEIVTQDDYEEASRLIDASKESLIREEDAEAGPAEGEDFWRDEQQRAHVHEDLLNPDDMRAALNEYQAQESNVEGVAQERPAGQDPTTAIYEIIRTELERDGGGAVFDAEMRQKVLLRGYSEKEYKAAVAEYMDLDVFVWSNEQKTAFRFGDAE